MLFKDWSIQFSSNLSAFYMYQKIYFVFGKKKITGEKYQCIPPR